MSTFVYSTRANLEGPWLVDKSALTELGEIVETIAKRFENANQDFIDAKAAKEFCDYKGDDRDDRMSSRRSELAELYTVSKTLSLSLSDSKSVREESVERLLSSPDLIHEAPTGLSIKIESHHRDAVVVFHRGSLTVETSPQADELSGEAFAALHLWASTHQAPWWQRAWKNYYWPAVFGWFALILMLASAYTDVTKVTAESVRPAAKQLLDRGITDKDVPKAVEILLRLQLHEPLAAGKKEEMPTWAKIVSLGGLVCVVGLFFRPPLLIGIGRNVRRIGRWRLWMHIVSATIPGFIFISVAWPYISTILGIPH